MEKNLSEIIRKYKNGFITRRVLINTLTPYILKIPEYLKITDKDIIYDFYAYIIGKIDNLIKTYKEYKSAKFLTWFNTVFKREFISYLRSRKFLNDETLKQIHLTFAHDLINLTDYSNEDIYKDSINLSVLTKKEQTVLSLKYGINTGIINIDESVKIILKKIEKKKQIQIKLEKKYVKILTLQKEIINEKDENKKNELTAKEIKTRNYKKKLEKKYTGFCILPSNRWVGNKLGLSEGTIAAYLFKIKKKLKKEYVGQV